MLSGDEEGKVQEYGNANRRVLLSSRWETPRLVRVGPAFSIVRMSLPVLPSCPSKPCYTSVEYHHREMAPGIGFFFRFHAPPWRNANWLFLSRLFEVKSVDRETVHSGSKQNVEVHEYRFTRRILFTSLNKVKLNSTEVSSFLVLIQAKNLISPQANIILYKKNSE